MQAAGDCCLSPPHRSSPARHVLCSATRAARKQEVCLTAVAVLHHDPEGLHHTMDLLIPLQGRRQGSLGWAAVGCEVDSMQFDGPPGPVSKLFPPPPWRSVDCTTATHAPSTPACITAHAPGSQA